MPGLTGSTREKGRCRAQGYRCDVRGNGEPIKANLKPGTAPASITLIHPKPRLVRGFAFMEFMRLTLTRYLSDDQGTLGVLASNGKRICEIGELPWRDNARGLSRIPAGAYRAEYMARSGSGKYRDVYHVTGVPGRSGVLIHKGNYSGDTTKGYRSDVLGCLLPGQRVGKLNNQRAVLASAGALQAIHAVTGRKAFTLQIIDLPGV